MAAAVVVIFVHATQVFCQVEPFHPPAGFRAAWMHFAVFFGLGEARMNCPCDGIGSFAAALLLSPCVFCVGTAVLSKVTGFLDKPRAEGEPNSNMLVRTRPDHQRPRLQIRPEQDLHRMHGVNASDLRGCQWVGRRRGAVRIPSERATDFIARRGLPPFSPGIAVEQTPQQRAGPQVCGQAPRS